VSEAPAAAPRWLSLGPASRLVGVDPDTLRRWADDGRVAAYVTPGGHRRFDRRTIEALVATRRPGSRPLASLGASPERLARAYRRSYAADPSGAAVAAVTTVTAVPAEDLAERERYRRDGRRLVEALVAHLDADPADAVERARSEAEATVLVDDLARRLAASGTSLTEAVGLFVAARRPFLDELTGLGRRRALDAARLAALYENASGLLDRLLLRLIATHQATAR
jgi:excisionase family DNA binding protein